MRSKWFVIPATLVALLLCGAVGVYAYDASRDDLIADGVTVGGVDLGGLRASEARAALDEQLAKPVSRPLTVTLDGREFTLSAHRARITADVEGMVQAALRESRDGNPLTRTVRALGGGEVEADIPARVSYSKRAVTALVKRVKRRVDRPARDASVSFSGSGIDKVAGKNGVAVRGVELERAIHAELVLPRADRVVEARTKTTKPGVTTADLATKHPNVIIVNRGSFQLRHYENLKLRKTYRIAVGQAGLDTPAGLYHIQNKAVNPAWHVPNSDWAGELAGKVIPPGPENPIKARWLGIFDGAGIHGTDAVNSLGTAASKGCVRMAIPEVIELYDRVNTGDPIYIA